MKIKGFCCQLSILVVSMLFSVFSFANIKHGVNDDLKEEKSALQLLNEKYHPDTNIDEDKSFKITETIEYGNLSDRDYIQNTSFDMSTYFENLYDYIPSNTEGTCSYVALIEVMSFYDTFYNDSIIPEQYEDKRTDCMTQQQVQLHSPGVRSRAYQNKQGSYHSFCHQNESEDLQSRFLVINNQLNGTDNATSFRADTNRTHYQNILNFFYSNTKNAQVNLFSNRSYDEYESIIKDAIDSGNPVVVEIETGRGGHAVVTYKYDENHIYANYGWGQFDCSNILPNSMNSIYGITTIDFSHMTHSHSNNYVINNKGICGCNLSDDIIFEQEPRYSNVSVTMFWMKDEYNTDETYTLIIPDLSNPNYLTNISLQYNQICFPISVYEQIVNIFNGSFCFGFRRNSTRSNFKTIYYTFGQNLAPLRHISLNSSDYNIYNQRDYLGSCTILKDDVSITARYAGLTKNDSSLFVSLMNYRSVPSYIEYSFDKDVHRIDLDLYIPFIDQNMIERLTGFKLYYYTDDGIKHMYVDLYNGFTIDQMMRKYVISFPFGIRRFRLEFDKDISILTDNAQIGIGNLDIYIQEE